jgi:transcriptional regulator with XRE-family HTH domain
MTPAGIFVDILRKRREQRGLSPEKLAASLRLHPHIIADWEAGKRSPRLASAIRWAVALDVEIELRERQNG